MQSTLIIHKSVGVKKVNQTHKKTARCRLYAIFCLNDAWFELFLQYYRNFVTFPLTLFIYWKHRKNETVYRRIFIFEQNVYYIYIMLLMKQELCSSDTWGQVEWFSVARHLACYWYALMHAALSQSLSYQPAGPAVVRYSPSVRSQRSLIAWFDRPIGHSLSRRN